MVMELGDYVVCGGIIDIYLLGDVGLVWFDLFGDMFDGVWWFDLVMQWIIEKLDVVELVLVFEVILDEVVIICFCQNYWFEFGVVGIDDLLYEVISVGCKYVGVEYWLGFFYDQLEMLFDYLFDVIIFVDD